MTRRIAPVRCFILWLHLCFSMLVDASRVMDAHELAVGEWSLILNRGFRSARSFPILAGLGTDTSTTSGKQQKSQQQKPKILPHGRRNNGLECHLTVHSDGTFSIVPALKPKGGSNSFLWPLRGQWKVLSNPYCITDRSYDQLKLESYPRVRTKGRRVGTQGRGEEGSDELQTVKIIFHCRVWGRYGSSNGGLFAKWRPNYPQGRMTHGTMLWDVIKNPDVGKNGTNTKIFLPQPRRSIVASFSAMRPASLQSTEQDLESQEIFGY